MKINIKRGVLMESALINFRYKGVVSVEDKREDSYFNSIGEGGLLIVERNALLLMEVLKSTSFQRTRDVIQVDYKVNEDVELTVLVTREAYDFRLLTIEWTQGSYAPVKTSKIWKTLEVEALGEKEIKDKISKLIDEALKVMNGDLVTCKYCKEKFHPSHTIDGGVCHSCAVKHLNVVF